MMSDGEPITDADFRDPRLIMHMLDTVYLERVARRDGEWFARSEAELEAMTVERLRRKQRLDRGSR